MRTQKGNDRLRPFFLEIFAGDEGISRSLRGRGLAAKAFDLRQGIAGDLSRRAVVRRIVRLLRSGCCRGVWFAPPCTTFSSARYPPLRSHGRPRGLQVKLLSDKDRQQLFDANCLIDNTLTLIRVCVWRWASLGRWRTRCRV